MQRRALAEQQFDPSQQESLKRQWFCGVKPRLRKLSITFGNLFLSEKIFWPKNIFPKRPGHLPHAGLRRPPKPLPWLTLSECLFFFGIYSLYSGGGWRPIWLPIFEGSNATFSLSYRNVEALGHGGAMSRRLCQAQVKASAWGNV